MTDRIAALKRLKAIQSEIDALLELFPELRLMEDMPSARGASHSEFGDSQPRMKTRLQSEPPR